MASADEEKKPQNAQEDANPFVAFRRFADDQVATLMNGIFSISSLFGSPPASPRRSIQDYDKWLQDTRESSQRLAHEAEEAGRIMDVYARAHKDGQHAMKEDMEASTSDDDSGPLRCPYRPAEQHFPRPDASLIDDASRSCLSLAALSPGFPSTICAAPVFGEQLSAVPVAYLLYSPYSPLRLEQQPYLCDHGAKWREAFEDLLAVQSGQDLPPRWQETRESSVDWVTAMIDVKKSEEDTQESGSAPSKTSELLKQYLGLLSCILSARQPENDADEDDFGDNDDLDDDGDAEVTELDVYDRLFGSQKPSSTVTPKAAARSFANLQQDECSSPSDADNKTPRILSTLTTTERTTRQDGSVYTKVVLKKRFYDGREESTETVHHQNAVRHTLDAASMSIKDKENAGENGKDKGTEENKSRGWFWS